MFLPTAHVHRLIVSVCLAFVVSAVYRLGPDRQCV